MTLLNLGTILIWKSLKRQCHEIFLYIFPRLLAVLAQSATLRAVFREYVLYLSAVFREYVLYLRAVFREYVLYLRAMFRKYVLYLRAVFREYVSQRTENFCITILAVKC